MVYLLSSSVQFPDPGRAEPNGLLAVGGDLRVARLLEAYRQGIFPWYNEGHPLMWWCPAPRPIITPQWLLLNERFTRYLRTHPFDVRVDQDFQAVISACAAMPRVGQCGTWITDAMIRAFFKLHKAGHAHSVECRLDGDLVGGIYGVSVGRAFYGESMFHTCSHASKVAFVHLVWLLEELKFYFMDCQQATPHVMRFGAREIPGDRFRRLALAAGSQQGASGLWSTPDWWADRLALRDRLRG